MTLSKRAAMFDLGGRAALVTGGSRGLGRAVALGLAHAGADVVIASRDLDGCRNAATAIQSETGRAIFPVRAHVGRWDELPVLIKACYERFGRLDVLVNNAGMSPVYDRLEDVTEELFEKVVNVNMKGPFRLAVLAATEMIRRGTGGSIINVTSFGAMRPRADMAPYAGAKAGLNAMTVALARAYGPTVRCNAILPGTFLTDIANAWDPDVLAARTATFALERAGAAEEVVGAALYLASDASSYTTGSLMVVDGGQP